MFPSCSSLSILFSKFQAKWLIRSSSQQGPSWQLVMLGMYPPLRKFEINQTPYYRKCECGVGYYYGLGFSWKWAGQWSRGRQIGWAYRESDGRSRSIHLAVGTRLRTQMGLSNLKTILEDPQVDVTLPQASCQSTGTNLSIFIGDSWRRYAICICSSAPAHQFITTSMEANWGGRASFFSSKPLMVKTLW